MGAWTGRMPTACLNDRQIMPREYRRWRDAHAQFACNAKDRQTVDEYKASIPKHGLPEPLILGISERYPDDVYVADGHHRAIALIDLGLREFGFSGTGSDPSASVWNNGLSRTAPWACSAGPPGDGC